MAVKYRIITLFAVVLLIAACTASQAYIDWGWSCYPTYDAQHNWVDTTIDIWWNRNSVSSFRFDLQADSTVAPLIDAVAYAPYLLTSTTNLGGGLYQVIGYAPAGTLPPPGDANLVDFVFSQTIPATATFTVSTGSNGYFVGVDSAGNQTTLGPSDIPPLTFTGPVTVIPEPSSIIALLGGFGALLTFRKRRA